MIQKVILLLGTLLAFTSYGQTFSYSFEGNLNASSIDQIQKTGIQLNQVKEFKVRYKGDLERGEVLIVLKDQGEKRAESDNQFNIIDVKSILLHHNLSPLNFRKLND